MLIGSIKENLSVEKRIAITPDVAKKYINLGFEISLSENYGIHLGITDNEFLSLGVNIIKDEQELINNSDIIIRVKVTDGMIVFPLSSKSKQVDVQGKFTRLNFTEQQAKNWKVHLAAEQGIVLKHEDIVLSESDLVEYRVVGESAQIYSYGCK